MQIKKSYLLEIVLSKQNNIPFPSNSFLDHKKIVGLQAFSAEQVSKSPLNKNVASQDVTSQGFINLQVAGEVYIDQMPINSTIASLNNGFIKEFVPMVLDIPKCKLQFPDSSVIEAGTVVLLQFFYID